MGDAVRFLIFSTQASAQAAVNQINSNAVPLLHGQGYAASLNNLIGKRLSDGASQPNGKITTTWDVPRQRLDGNWIVSHPENMPGSSVVIDANGTTAAQAAMSGVTYDSIQDYSSAWFPAPKVVP